MSINDLIHTNARHAYEQGVKTEQERIVELLEAERRKCEQAGLFANGLELREQLQTVFIGLEAAIALIKGEDNPDICEPADLPCVNGFSCEKHQMSIEDAMRFIKGEQK